MEVLLPSQPLWFYCLLILIECGLIFTRTVCLRLLLKSTRTPSPPMTETVALITEIRQLEAILQAGVTIILALCWDWLGVLLNVPVVVQNIRDYLRSGFEHTTGASKATRRQISQQFLFIVIEYTMALIYYIYAVTIAASLQYVTISV